MYKTGSDVSIDASLAGTGALTKTGIGTLTLSGINTYDGATTINGGILELQNGEALNNANAVTVNGTGVLEVDDAETIGSLAGAGGLTLNDTLTTGGCLDHRILRKYHRKWRTDQTRHRNVHAQRYPIPTTEIPQSTMARCRQTVSRPLATARTSRLPTLPHSI